MIQKIPVRNETDQHFCEMQPSRGLENLGSLVGSIAHDFNTLLLSILGYTELTLEKLSKDDPIRKNIEEIHIAANCATELNNQMLLYSDNAHREVKATDLNKIIRDVGRLLSVSISKNIRVGYELTDSIPPIKANPLQIQQVVMNLIVNASDAIGESSGVITISSGVGKPAASLWKSQGKVSGGCYCYIKVTDTGCGMDSATRDKVFEPYFTTKPNGHGLGMVAVTEIVESHQGVIKLDTSPGSGTTFTVWFPCAQQPCEILSEQTPGHNARVGSGTVLVVDDEPDVLTVITAMLEHQGFRVLSAGDGQRCLEILSGDIPVDVMLLDMLLSGMSAREILRWGRKLRPNLPVVLCSGCDRREAMRIFEGENLAGFIQKPFSLHGILMELLKVLSAHNPQTPQPALPKKFSASV